MPSPINIEYRNQNEHRNYPFADNMLLRDDTGVALPTDFLIDVYLYPVDLVGKPYLASIDTGVSRLYFADTATGSLLGYASLITGAGVAHVVDMQYGRTIGVVVYGAGAQQILYGATNRTFEPTQTELCVATYIQLKQSGVRGLLVGDDLLTGHIKFEGENGMLVYTVFSDLYFDAVGIPPLDEEDDCTDELCSPVKTLRCERVPGSAFRINKLTDCVLAVQANGFTLTDICAAQKTMKLPDQQGNLPLKPKTGDDPCGTLPPPKPPTPPGPTEIVDFLAEDCSSLQIVTPSASDNANPIAVQSIDSTGNVPAFRVMMPVVPDQLGAVTRNLDKFRDPPFGTDGLKISILGTKQAKRGK